MIWALDFGGPGGEESFRPFARRGLPGLELKRLRPPGLDGRPLPALDTDAFVEHYLGGADPAADRPRMIFGYCVGGVFALALAERLRRLGSPVERVVLFDTVPARSEHVGYEFERTLRDLGWREDAPLGVDVPAERAAAVPVLVRDLDAGLVLLEAAVRRFVEAFLGARGAAGPVRDRLAGTLVARCGSWLRFVAASTVHRPLEFAAPVQCLVSAQLRERAEEYWAPLPVAVRSVDCSHSELLASQECHDLLLETLAVPAS
ncbi:thioesterase domain-containing protein [Streptomyces sp. NRRL S-495]|uniref:thioesterase domain-containing protein n=1 Tax=Streptomyces sp. NRRL S-495 TaxID=1609133 RepID=UPI0005F93AA1|nr:thioesterase domain-containing protein [Streptomyces sp. NRRL S-495]KJY36999.1 hypothetical protein VR45_09950 [Streptomyces sp. NRRL S-495]